MNELQKFFNEGFTAQLKVAGDSVTLSNPKTKTTSTFNAVLTEQSGDLQVEIGSVFYQVSAHILIPQEYEPSIGNTITHGTNTYKIITCVKSPFEVAYSCNLVKI